jgi:lipopolysaccharide transport system ATP-binding protein
MLSIRAEGVGKCYRLGETHKRYRTLRETISERVAHPFGHRAGVPDNEFWALQDVGFDLQPGEVLGVIGRNGAGKSTLLKVLSKITAPTTGSVRVRGRVGSLLEVGSGFHPELTGRENIMLNGSILGMRRSEIARRFDSIVEFAEIGPFLDTPVKRYSSGMYVRLAFAVAAHLEPEVLIIDEVLAVGDAEFQKRCLGKIAEIGSDGRTVLFVSHNMAAVQSLCSRVILLESGTVTTDGSPREVVHQYLGGAGASSAERTWAIDRAPRGNGMLLLAVRVSGATGGPLALVNASEDCTVEIEYAVDDGVRAGVTLLLSNSEGVLVLGSLDNKQPDWHHRPRAAGVYRSTCTIPGNLLNTGDYSVGAILWRDSYRIAVREDDAVQFRVAEDGVLRGDYMGGHEGIVRPSFKWTTELLVNH